MGKGTPTNFFDFNKWFGNSVSWQNWGQSGPKGPSSTPPESSGGASGPTTTLTVTFNSEEAGYANAMGWYNARTGEAGILFKNTNDDGWNAGVKAGDTRNLTVLQSDVDANNVGFFLIPNGANELSSSTLSSTMKFQVGSNGDGKIIIDRQWGHDVVLSGSEVLFSNQVHNKGDFDYVSGKVGTQGQTWAQKTGSQSDGTDGILGTMAWDDQSMNGCGGTDRDFNDVVFTVTKSGGTNPPPNGAPTDINLSSATINENVAGGVIGMLSTVDPNAGDKHSYTVSDSRFEVVNGQLKLKSGVSLDYESQSSVQLQVTTTDQGGLGYSENFTIQVKDVGESTNAAPTSITLNGGMVTENVIGAVVGALTTTDPDVGDTHTYKVDDNRFEVVGNQLQLKSGVSLDFEDKSSFVVNVTTTDQGGLGYSDSFFIFVKNVAEAPSDIGLSNLSVNENEYEVVVGTLSTIDDDAGGTHSYKVEDDRFVIVGNQLLVGDNSLDHELEPSVTINVTSTDSTGSSVTKAFTIEVKDMNEAPVAPFDNDSTANFVADSAAVGTKVGITGLSIDFDAGDSITYELSNDAGGLFAIDAATGVVTVAGVLDADVATEHAITVRATDSFGEFSESDFTINVGDGMSLMAFGTGSLDTFLLDLAQEAVTTLVGFNRTNDRLSFSGVADADSNGSIGLNDLLAMVSGVSDFGSGSDVVVDFTTGASVIFQGAGTPGGNVSSLSSLVSNPSTQFQFA